MSTPTITRIDVDYVTMLDNRVVRYRWNTSESDQWRRALTVEESRRRWDHTSNRLSQLPAYVVSQASDRLQTLKMRTRNTVAYDAEVKNIEQNGKQFLADVMLLNK